MCQHTCAPAQTCAPCTCMRLSLRATFHPATYLARTHCAHARAWPSDSPPLPQSRQWGRVKPAEGWDASNANPSTGMPAVAPSPLPGVRVCVCCVCVCGGVVVW